MCFLHWENYIYIDDFNIYITGHLLQQITLPRCKCGVHSLWPQHGDLKLYKIHWRIQHGLFPPCWHFTYFSPSFSEPSSLSAQGCWLSQWWQCIRLSCCQHNVNGIYTYLLTLYRYMYIFNILLINMHEKQQEQCNTLCPRSRPCPWCSWSTLETGGWRCSSPDTLCSGQSCHEYCRHIHTVYSVFAFYGITLPPKK